ncbi:nitroreductase family deazaflavin-dependent oxidoreductase [Ornithinimicrobium cavernae]|uniref:nitroreductase family deazaflavin-dependent oxidoreductase n=1 Tax=Ornithinimicrobium cavernae TaxID=2666047 RepID=UPI000D697E7C|nr:nitroreductase family deazaflavin-dependent oxidoreductase [Ornithinimicrobium cavernae]
MPAPLSVTPYVNRFANPVLRNLAGLGWFVALEHAGRRTGKVHRTPLLAFREGDAVTIALTYGPEVQWLKNIRASGRARMLWRGRVLGLGAVRDLSTAEGLARMPQPIRFVFDRTGFCTDFVELPVLTERPSNGPLAAD